MPPKAVLGGPHPGFGRPLQAWSASLPACRCVPCQWSQRRGCARVQVGNPREGRRRPANGATPTSCSYMVDIGETLAAFATASSRAAAMLARTDAFIAVCGM